MADVLYTRPAYQEWVRPPSDITGTRVVGGTVSRLGTPLSARVFLFRRSTMQLIDCVVSNASGQYQFTQLQESAIPALFVMALDESADPVNAAVSDYVTPEPM